MTELVIISSGIILSLIYTSSYYNQNKVRSLPSFNSIPNHSQNNSTGNTPYRTNDDNTSNNPLQYQKNNNLIECIGPDGKTFNTTQTECDKLNSAWGVTPTPNPDQIIQCEIDTACGGGYREMKRSACLSMVCCETVSGWIVTARDVCSQTHKSTTNSFCYDIYNSYQSTNDSVCGLYKDKSLFPTSKEYNDCIDNQNKQNSEYLNKCLNN